MTEQAPHMDSNWNERVKRISNRSAEDKFFDAVGGAAITYAKEKAEEARQWENAYNVEKAQKEYLLKILEQNGIPVPDFSSGIPPSVPIITKKSSKEKHFKDLMQCEDKENILSRLHSHIDGQGGKAVALILLKAKDEKLISKLPSEKEFYSEFKETEGKWRSISHFLNPNCCPAPDISSVII